MLKESGEEEKHINIKKKQKTENRKRKKQKTNNNKIQITKNNLISFFDPNISKLK
jgi:hypothetical protein